MYDQTENDMELEKIQTNTETQPIAQEEFTTTPYDAKPIHKTPQSTPTSTVKLTGNLPKDIVTLMSTKPEHYQISFTGLKRILGNVHQQQLVNTIDRLMDDSILLKSQDGYELAGNMIKPNLRHDQWSETFMGKKLYLSPIPVQKIYRDLYGKWYGKNRFLGGMIDVKNNEAFLEWINMTDQKSQTRLEIRPNELIAKFNNVGFFERDKAINVFSDVLNAHNQPIMFEQTGPTFMNN